MEEIAAEYLELIRLVYFLAIKTLIFFFYGLLYNLKIKF